jgi:KaiC/GvpD/RAD55 family RecA-like ATPase
MSLAPRERIQAGTPGFDEIVHGGLRTEPDER